MRMLAAPYQLKSRAAAFDRFESRGRLVAVFFGDAVGFAPIHGPGSYDQLQVMLRYARIDALARARGESLRREVPQSHTLLGVLADSAHWPEGKCVKIKIGRHWATECKLLERACSRYERLRLDANSLFTQDTFMDLWRILEPFAPKIDFIEDPVPYHPENWRAIEQLGVRLAYDGLSPPSSIGYSVQVIKPALGHFKPLWPGKTYVVTSYADSFYGEQMAIYDAAYYKQMYPELIFEMPGMSAQQIWDEDTSSSEPGFGAWPVLSGLFEEFSYGDSASSSHAG